MGQPGFLLHMLFLYMQGIHFCMEKDAIVQATPKCNMTQVTDHLAVLFGEIKKKTQMLPRLWNRLVY